MSAASSIRRAAKLGDASELSREERTILAAYRDEYAEDMWDLWELDGGAWGTYLLLVAEELSPTLPAWEFGLAVGAIEIVAKNTSRYGHMRSSLEDAAAALRDLVKGEA